jgi:hypothetical protein
LVVTLNIQQVLTGEYDIEVYGQVPDWTYGIADFEITLTTPGTVGESVPKEGKDAFGFPTGKVVTTWALNPSFWLTIDPAYLDSEGDTDPDAVGLSAAETATADIYVGVGPPQLLATERWICHVAPPGGTFIDVIVSPASRVFDPGAPGLKRPFDVVQGIGGNANIPEPGTLALLAVGGLLAVARRRRR